MKLTDKQCAVILVRNWLYGREAPYEYDTEEMSNILEFKREMTEERRQRILTHVDNITNPLKERIENLYSKIEGWD